MDYTTWVTGKGIAVRPEVSNFRMDIANCPIIGFPRGISGKKGQQNKEREGATDERRLARGRRLKQKQIYRNFTLNYWVVFTKCDWDNNNNGLSGWAINSKMKL